MLGTQNVPTIQCARCDRPVAGTEMRYIERDRTYWFRVFCHGEVEECSVPFEFFVEGGQLPTEGRAFTVARLT